MVGPLQSIYPTSSTAGHCSDARWRNSPPNNLILAEFRNHLAVKSFDGEVFFFGGETSKIGGIEKICQKDGEFLNIRVKFNILQIFFCKLFLKL